MQRLILFDIDGTLVDTGGAGRMALQKAFEQLFGIRDYENLTRHVNFGGRTDPDIIGDLANAAGVPGDTMRSCEERFRQVYFDCLANVMQRPHSGRRTYPGVRLLLQRLWESGIALSLVTGNYERSARLKLEPFGVNDYFPTGGFGSDDRDRTRIAHTAWQRAIRHEGRQFRPQDVTVVGDTARDVNCARENGFRAVVVRTGWASPGELEEAHPDTLLADLSDLSASMRALGID